MQRKLIPSLRVLAAAAAVVTIIACADAADPTSPSTLQNEAGARADSASCDITVSGMIWRYAGRGDSASDTLGRLVPLPGARVEFYFVAPLPQDSVPRDSVPRDSVPRDSVPRDSVPRDSVPRDSTRNDTLFARAFAMSSAAAPDTGRGSGNGGGVDTTRGPARQPDAKGTSRGNGSYSVDGLCPGVYRVVVNEPGTQRSISTWIIVRDDIPYLNFAFPPRR